MANRQTGAILNVTQVKALTMQMERSFKIKTWTRKAKSKVMLKRLKRLIRM